MPANLPPDYYAVEKRYREASSVSEKIELLREMLAIMPKHKGTEHLQGDLKRRIAKLNSQAQKKQGATRASGLDHIPREGAGQVVLVGVPNAGKSSIVAKMTNAHTEVADYPFSTFKPVQGMMAYEDIQIQLVDLPPVSQAYSESWMFNIIRLADLVLLIVDLSQPNPEEQVLEICSLLESHKIILQREGEGRPQSAIAYKSTLLVGTKVDTDGAQQKAEQLISVFGGEYPYTFISIETGFNLNEFLAIVFNGLKVLRVYTKTPGKKSDLTHPYVLPQGATVHDAAVMIHKEIAERMHYARIWGSEKYDGQRVERDHVMADGDVLEVHIK